MFSDDSLRFATMIKLLSEYYDEVLQMKVLKCNFNCPAKNM